MCGGNVGKILEQAAPVMAGVVGGPLAGALVGGGEGLLGGGGVRGALMGGLSGYGAGTLGSGLGTMGSGLMNGASLGNAFSAGFPTISNLGSSIEHGLSSGLSDVGSLFSGTAPAAASSGLDGMQAGGALLSSPSAIEGSLGSGAINALNPVDRQLAANAALGAGGGSSTLNNFLNTGSTLASAAPQAAGAAAPAAAAGGGASAFKGLGPILSGVSGLMNANATANADKQMIAGQEANRKMVQPFVNAGTAGANEYQNLLTNPQLALQNNPGYQFQLDQGNNALNNQMSASGLTGSGAALKAAQQFGQGLAATTYQSALANALGGMQGTMGYMGGLAPAAGYNTAIGNIGAGGSVMQNGNLMSTLASLFGQQQTPMY
ncbi:MAG: hypothetical protein KGL39_36965 [Patescibacteria group bacterium]|nr:hypothetical protein [Patescibacteria group bacterium]